LAGHHPFYPPGIKGNATTYGGHLEHDGNRPPLPQNRIASPGGTDHSTGMIQDEIQLFINRMKSDLRSAMLARQTERVSVLRALIAAVDNSQAVPVGEMHDKYVVRAFGDKSVEVPRKALSVADLRAILVDEIAARRNAADEYARANRPDAAERLLGEAGTIGHYLSLVGQEP